MQANSKMQIYESRDYSGRSKYLYLLMLHDYINLATAHLSEVKEKLVKLAVLSFLTILEEQKTKLIKDLNHLAVTLTDENRHTTVSLEQV